MYVSMHPNDLNTVFRLHALKMGDYYIGSENNGYYDFIVGKGWDPDPALSEIMTTLSEDEDRPIAIVLGHHRIRIDPVIGGELFCCLFAYIDVVDPETYRKTGPASS